VDPHGAEVGNEPRSKNARVATSSGRPGAEARRRRLPAQTGAPAPQVLLPDGRRGLLCMRHSSGRAILCTRSLVACPAPANASRVRRALGLVFERIIDGPASASLGDTIGSGFSRADAPRDG
jgi:hypothetical protein